jgi:hypothetical protein
MANKVKNLVGMRFGMLVVLREVGRKPGKQTEQGRKNYAIGAKNHWKIRKQKYGPRGNKTIV